MTISARCRPGLRLRPVLTVTLLCGVLAGCSEYLDRRDTISLAAGDALHANQVAQMIDPWPAASRDRTIQGNGQRMQKAAQRYRENRVTPPRASGTSSAAYTPPPTPIAPPGAP